MAIAAPHSAADDGQLLIDYTNKRFWGTLLGTLLAKGKPWIDVSHPDFGGTGNGVHDDEPAAQAATTYATNTAINPTGGAVFFPAGIWLLNTFNSIGGTNIMVNALTGNIRWFGLGAASIIRQGSAVAANAGLFGFGNIPGFTYESAAGYNFNVAARGDPSVTTATAADAANFIVGDVIFLKGVGVSGGEINIVRSVNAGTGVIGLRYQLAKDFAGGTRVAIVATALTTQNYEFESLTIQYNNAVGQAVIGAQVIGFKVRNCSISSDAGGAGGPPFQLNYIRNCILEGNEFAWTSNAVVSNGIESGRSSMDFRIVDNRIRSSCTCVDAPEGAAHWVVADNHFYSIDTITLGTSCFAAGAAFDILVENNTAYCTANSASTPAFNDNNGGASAEIVFSNNRINLTGTSGNYVFKIQSPGTLVVGNTCRSNVSFLWAIEDCTVLGNVCFQTTVADGIIVQLAPAHKCRIIGNDIVTLGARGAAAVRVIDDGAQLVSPIIMLNKFTNWTTGIVVANLANDPTIVTGPNQYDNCTTATSPAIAHIFSASPAGVAAIAVGASPFTYTNNDGVPEAVYIFGGTVTTVAKNAINIFSHGGVAVPGDTVWLQPLETVTVTYTVAPTMNKDRK